ncbi:MAG TPA: helical backbone metal receptor [Pseudomonadales bacterium]|nr:helical backbone metal receptor [Pseudomonadales bacterium]
MASVDGIGRSVTLPAPPQRIAALAPHLVELLFALDAGERVVATVAWADHPAAAMAIPRVGDAFNLSLEVLAAQRPDLILAWRGALGADGLASLQRLGVPVWVSDPADLAAVAGEFAALAALLDVDPAPALAFGARLAALQGATGEPLAVLPLISLAPPMTVSDEHFLGDLLHRCGAWNPEGAGEVGPVLALSKERLLRTPARFVLVTAPASAGELSALRLPAAAEPLWLDADLFVRPGPRLIDGAEQLCARLAEVR